MTCAQSIKDGQTATKGDRAGGVQIENRPTLVQAQRQIRVQSKLRTAAAAKAIRHGYQGSIM